MALPIFLYTGPENGEKNDAIKNLKDSLTKKFGQIEECLFYATETSATEYLAILQNENLFVPSTFVLVKMCETLKKSDIELILDWAKIVKSEKNVLVLTSDEISVDSKLDKAIPQTNKKIFWEMFEDRKALWVSDFFRKNGFSIEQDASELILEMIENNTEALKNECSRFFVCFEKGHTITQDDVEKILSHTREENAFSLFDAMSDCFEENTTRLEKSLEILQKIRLSKENSSVMLIAGLTSCFRKLNIWQKLNSEGKGDDFNLKINGFTSKKMKNQYSRASKIWTAAQTNAILALLSQTDMQIRSGGTQLEEILLQKMMYEIIVKKGAASAQYETE